MQFLGEMENGRAECRSTEHGVPSIGELCTEYGVPSTGELSTEYRKRRDEYRRAEYGEVSDSCIFLTFECVHVKNT